MTMVLPLLLQAAVPQEPADQPQIVSQAMLDHFSADCGTPKKWLRHRGANTVQFQPSRRARYAQVDCLLQHLKDSKVPMNLGFVGNEALPDAGKQ
ncbi:class II D-tagatose-bisphosphate aldolase, non-catalytic subunit [Sphingobium ummariense]|uniref:class II D-tagatose-bisphosphate aldolase, non-catalytic subunit n=1 Tax=Sphingobium ummariense TaxID=420994 RepID=UPI0013790AD6|nr:class II D-tagatose-bisphosphate aldolase, non-catalytic subunit [Sphingobium ummariense]